MVLPQKPVLPCIERRARTGDRQARNLAVGERLQGIRVVIRDRDAKFSGPFDEVICSEGLN
ncbi:MAG: hypothetical protein ACRDHK_07285, partial [Actinomycetota bacterium]